MELDWSTFALEILNFMILLWILKRFLYKPVLDVIARRKAGIEQVLGDARRLKQDAQSLREQYERRVAEWQQERDKARSQLDEELAAERTRLQGQLRASLEQDRERAVALEQRRLDDLSRQTEETALTHAAGFASRLLSSVAGPDVERRIIDLAVQALLAIPEARQEEIRRALPADVVAKISTAFPMAQAQREAVGQALQRVVGRPVACDYSQNPALKAGMRISMDAWVLGANLEDELKSFVQAASHGD